MGRNCAECGDWCHSSDFSSNQYRKGPGYSRCMDCVSSMRECSQCYRRKYPSDYSNNQWGKGDGYSRCRDCVDNSCYCCDECGRTFQNQNNLNMHMQVHRPRTVSCPVCGETRFGSGANAVQHVESGYCSGCRGASNARRQIYEFASRQRKMQSYVSGRPLITNGNSRQGGVPDYPYHCPQCGIKYRQLSQLLQHQDNSHGNSRLLSY